MSDLSGWALVATSAALVIATVFLYYSNSKLWRHTANLVNATNQLKAATDKLGQLQVAPALAFGQPAIVGARNGTSMRFTVTNKGLGSARIAAQRGSINNRDLARITPASPGEAVLGPGEPFSYDIENVSQGDSVYVEIEFEDVDGNKYKVTRTLTTR